MWWYRGLRALGRRCCSSARWRDRRSPAACSTRAAAPAACCGCSGPTSPAAPTLGLEYDTVAAALATAKAGRPVVAGSVNEMPLGDGTLAAYVSLDVLCHGGGRPGARPRPRRVAASGPAHLPSSICRPMGGCCRRTTDACTMSAASPAARRAPCSGPRLPRPQIQLLEYALVSPDAAPPPCRTRRRRKRRARLSALARRAVLRRPGRRAGGDRRPASACRSAVR